MKNLIPRIIRVVLIVTIPSIILTSIDFLTEITGGKLGEYLQEQYGINKKTLFFFLLVLILLSLTYEIYQRWHEEKEKSELVNNETVEPQIKLLVEYFKRLSEDKTGEEVNVSLGFKSDENEDFVSDDVDNYLRAKKTDGINIFPSKKVYGRINVKDADWQKEFTVCYPIIEGIESESILHKINSALNYEKVFDVSINESIESDTWLSELDYSIRFIKKPFLVIELHMDGIGAYPWHVSQNIVINFETGERVMIKDLFKKESLKRLASIVDEFVQLDLKFASLREEYIDEIPLKLELKSDEEEIERINWLKERFDQERVKISDLNNFSLGEYGVTFIHDFGFPHVIKALEPEGHYYFEYSSLKQFIKKDSILERFIQENLPEILDIN